MEQIRTYNSISEMMEKLFKRLSEMEYNVGSIYTAWQPLLNDENLVKKQQLIDGWQRTDAMNCKSAKIKGILEWSEDKLKIRKVKNVKDINK